MRHAVVVLMTLSLLATSAVVALADPAPRGIEAGCPESRLVSAGFEDTAGSIFETEIDCVVWWGIASGRSATSYGPGVSTNRAQMATFFANLLRETEAELPEDPPESFDDVSGSVHADNINALAALEIVQGTSANTYSPSRAVTRAQMATFIYRTYEHITGEKLESDEDYFSDAEGSVHEDAINAIAEVGITGGDADGNFRPRADVTRGQMAAFLSRLLDLLVDTGFATPPPPPAAVLGHELDGVAQGGTGGQRRYCSGYLKGSGTIDGTLYEQSLGCDMWAHEGRTHSGWEEFNLGREYTRLTTTVGQNDNSSITGDVIRFTVYGDGQKLDEVQMTFGSGHKFDLDVTDVLRLRLEVANLSSRSQSGVTKIIWGDPTVQ